MYQPIGGLPTNILRFYPMTFEVLNHQQIEVLNHQYTGTEIYKNIYKYIKEQINNIQFSQINLRKLVRKNTGFLCLERRNKI